MEEQLWKACSDGRAEEVKQLLQNEQINTNWQDLEHSRTPFYIACKNGHIEIVKLLLNDNRVDITKTQSKEATPLWIACQEGQIEVVKLLLNDPRVDINKATNRSETPFYIACQEGHIEIVKYMLSCGREIDINKAKNNSTNTQNPFLMVTWTPLEVSKQRSSGYKFLGEAEEEFQKAKRNCPKIVKLIEIAQRNQNQNETKMKKELAVCKFFFYVRNIYFLLLLFFLYILN